MSHLSRKYTCPSEWTYQTLEAFNIHVLMVEPEDFFGQHYVAASVAAIPPLIFDIDNINEAVQRAPGDIIKYFDYLNLATTLPQESTVDCLVQETLRLLHFDAQRLLVVQHFRYPFEMCGKAVTTETDVALIHPSLLLLLIAVEDKPFTPLKYPEPQVIAEAIAAFQYNNERRRDMGLDPLSAWSVPCMTMRGATPTLYVVDVTDELSRAIIHGDYPETATTVRRCKGSWLKGSGDWVVTSGGIEKKGFRRAMFRDLDAFRLLARELRAPLHPIFAQEDNDEATHAAAPTGSQV
ncbi:hypothetical protein DACRYDRAFT_21583 [Dacryopinax primogenitus]|uniref:Uncharacterized protein n=1 Tax=Dacryopinax primogenitus (strain DJM 731) TaxID=1858805 RepID=M5GEM5_DACPD|nr:uncharacterized protein DACRYDRAFT_21583 [Dacryopinax primogenitus]EJU03398.1 hypothetical protein DACRYDRAFT_21583 [Dacryopinax primogenitus]